MLPLEVVMVPLGQVMMRVWQVLNVLMVHVHPIVIWVLVITRIVPIVVMGFVIGGGVLTLTLVLRGVGPVVRVRVVEGVEHLVLALFHWLTIVHSIVLVVQLRVHQMLMVVLNVVVSVPVVHNSGLAVMAHIMMATDLVMADLMMGTYLVMRVIAVTVVVAWLDVIGLAFVVRADGVVAVVSDHVSIFVKLVMVSLDVGVTVVVHTVQGRLMDVVLVVVLLNVSLVVLRFVMTLFVMDNLRLKVMLLGGNREVLVFLVVLHGGLRSVVS